MTMTPEQRKLALTVADWAESGGDRAVSYDQQTYISTGGRVISVRKMREGQCGTAACIAGYTAILTAPEGMVSDGGWLMRPDGAAPGNGSLDLHDFAADQLGLTAEQADILFLDSGSNTAPKLLRWIVDNPSATERETREKLEKLEAEAGEFRDVTDQYIKPEG